MSFAACRGRYTEHERRKRSLKVRFCMQARFVSCIWKICNALRSATLSIRQIAISVANRRAKVAPTASPPGRISASNPYLLVRMNNCLSIYLSVHCRYRIALGFREVHDGVAGVPNGFDPDFGSGPKPRQTWLQTSNSYSNNPVPSCFRPIAWHPHCTRSAGYLWVHIDPARASLLQSGL